MVDLERLTQRASRAYEIGRLRMAALIVIVLAPICIVCVVLSGAREECACLGALLMIAAVVLRWRSAQGVSAVTSGLVAGAVPLALGLAIAGFKCPPELAFACAIGCGVAGLVAGAVVGVRAVRRKMRAVDWLVSSAVALLAASVGCVGVETGVAGVTIGLVGGVLATASIGRLRVAR